MRRQTGLRSAGVRGCAGILPRVATDAPGRGVRPVARENICAISARLLGVVRCLACHSWQGCRTSVGTPPIREQRLVCQIVAPHAQPAFVSHFRGFSHCAIALRRTSLGTQLQDMWGCEMLCCDSPPTLRLASRCVLGPQACHGDDEPSSTMVDFSLMLGIGDGAQFIVCARLRLKVRHCLVVGSLRSRALLVSSLSSQIVRGWRHVVVLLSYATTCCLALALVQCVFGLSGSDTSPPPHCRGNAGRASLLGGGIWGLFARPLPRSTASRTEGPAGVEMTVQLAIAVLFDCNCGGLCIGCLCYRRRCRFATTLTLPHLSPGIECCPLPNSRGVPTTDWGATITAGRGMGMPWAPQ